MITQPKISVILPFYHKADYFIQAYPLNDLYRNPRVEVVCVLDEPGDEAPMLRHIRKTKKRTRYQLIVHKKDHEWRPPCIAYNIGIRRARGELVILADPESILKVIGLPASSDLNRAYAGLVWHLYSCEPARLRSEHFLALAVSNTELNEPPWLWGYGFLMVQKEKLVRLCGLDEERTGYGHDDSDIRIRLTRIGVETIISPDIKVFHPYHENAVKRVVTGSPGSRVILENQKRTWGLYRGRWRTAYDWRKQ